MQIMIQDMVMAKVVWTALQKVGYTVNTTKVAVNVSYDDSIQPSDFDNK